MQRGYLLKISHSRLEFLWKPRMEDGDASQFSVTENGYFSPNAYASNAAQSQ